MKRLDFFPLNFLEENLWTSIPYIFILKTDITWCLLRLVFLRISLTLTDFILKVNVCNSVFKIVSPHWKLFCHQRTTKLFEFWFCIFFFILLRYALNLSIGLLLFWIPLKTLGCFQFSITKLFSSFYLIQRYNLQLCKNIKLVCLAHLYSL